MKLKIGNYVRNKYGIAKIIDIQNKNGITTLVFDKKICYLIDTRTGEEVSDRLVDCLPIMPHINLEKIESSNELIKLIKVGDFVNGHMVFDVTPYCVYIENNGNKLAHIPYTEKDIRNVLTKEQYECQMYKKY